MVAIIIYYLLISFTCLWAGFLSANLFTKLLQAGNEQVLNKHWIIYAFWGLIFVTLFGQVVELFMPVNQYTWLSLTLLLGIVSLFNKYFFKNFFLWLKNITRLRPAVFLICIILALSISVINSGPTLMDDTESYHIQMIKWIQEYGTIPGLANLHERYGFNSAWFTFASLFVPQHSPYNFFTVANGVLSVWLSIYLFTGFWEWSQSNNDLKNATTSISLLLVFIVALFCWPMLRGNATNANYDFVTSCMIIVLFIEVWKQKDSNDQWKGLLSELLVWPVFLFTVRIINFPILLVSLFAFIVLMREKKIHLLLTCIIISLGLVLPFLTRNVLLSGYMFYPAYQVDIFSVDWKADRNTTEKLLSYIKYFNRVNAGSKPIAETQKLGFPEWIPAWFHYLFNYDKPVLLLSMGGYLLGIARIRLFRRLILPVKLFTGALVLQLISWFLFAPDPRFVYGPILTGIFLIPFFLPKFFLELIYKNKKIIILLSIVLLGGITIYIIRKVLVDHRYYNPLLPAALPIPPTRLIKIDNIEYRIPEKILGNWNARCYATDLPCLYFIQPGLSARGKTIRDGFKLKE